MKTDDLDSPIRVLRDLSLAFGQFIEAGLVEQRSFASLYGRRITRAERRKFLELVGVERVAYRTYQRAVRETLAIVRTQAEGGR